METDKRDGRRIELREQRIVRCHHCENDNLIHGLYLAKASTQMMIGGPGQEPKYIGAKWALYYCIGCQNYFPYPKAYRAPGEQETLLMYKQIHNYFVAQAEAKDQRNEDSKRLISIIQSNKDLLGLPGVEREDNMEAILRPLLDRIDQLESEFRAKKGGRPKHCSVGQCKANAESDGLCKAHKMS